MKSMIVFSWVIQIGAALSALLLAIDATFIAADWFEISKDIVNVVSMSCLATFMHYFRDMAKVLRSIS